MADATPAVCVLTIAADPERRFYVGDLTDMPPDLDLRLVAVIELRDPAEARALALSLLSTGEPACAE